MKAPSAEIVSMQQAESGIEEPQGLALTPGVKGENIPWQTYKKLLREVGLRPTRARMILSWILFGRGNRHVTAEMLYEEAMGARIPVSLATVYNTLNQFTEAGLLRQIGVDGSKSFFDTNPSEHHHFFVQGEEELLDIPTTQTLLDRSPQAPEGFEIARIDVVVRLRRKEAQN
jgi:Fur family transcriptional regulator, iron response regulator